jgi:translation initiation factor IF-2
MAKEKQAILIPDYLTVRELAELIEASPIEVMKQLIANGIMASINQQVDFDTAAIVLEELGYDAQSQSQVAAEAEREEAAKSQEWRQLYVAEKPENLKARPPIVTILGHVDHGKTTLLDTIRKTRVVDGEAGGITQRIGAYRAQHNGRGITFIDTPGHEAFTAMRARGAQGADIAILVVAADDGVMQTTREAINHARAANVPIIVAITKVDKRNANIEFVKQQLADVGLVPDEWEGSTLVVPVAALQGEGIDDLLEAVLLVADDSSIVANPTANPAGVVLEAEIDPSRGVIATLLVLNGELKRGDTIIAGHASGRIKAMFDDTGKIVNSAGPSMPVRVMGLSDLPEPGDSFEWVKNDKIARQMLDERASNEVQVGAARQPFTLQDVFAQFASGNAKSLNLIVKADFQGTLQPIVDSLEQLSGQNADGIEINVLSAEIGNIGENDVMLASASRAIVIGFNVDIDNAARRSADSQGVDIRVYNIIYKLLEDIELALHGMLEPAYADKVIGTAEVRQVFRISRVGVIAGSIVQDGIVRRNAKARVLRKGKVLVESTSVSSLKRINEDAREVRAGFECGIGLDGFNDFEEGDILEFYVTELVS